MMPLALAIGKYLFLILLVGFVYWAVHIIAADLRRSISSQLGEQATPRLVVLEGKRPFAGEVFEIVSREVTFGRAAENLIVVADSFASSRHARLLRDRDGLWVEDLGSTNGTFVNGQRLTQPVLLNPGDRIGVGDAVFQYEP